MQGFTPDLEAWDAWHPTEVARRLAELDLPWYVAGGWAIDLFLGNERRPHDDLEIGIPRNRFDSIAEALPELEWFTAGSGRVWPLPQRTDRFEEHHQTWGRDRATGHWRIDVMREPYDGNIWIARRDPRIRMPYDELIRRTPDGIPYGAPEAMLLFKAKATRPKDESDLAAALPAMTVRSRQWLIAALEVAHPGHHWLTILRNDEP